MDEQLPPDLVLTVSTPPSANALWAHPGAGKPRVRSDAYRKWLHDAGWAIRMQAHGFKTLLCTFDALLLVPQRSKRDRDNWSKPIFDLLQAVGIVRNDSGLRNYSVRGDDRDDCYVALWDRGGPEQNARKPLRITKAKKRPSVRQIARTEAVRQRHLP